MSTTTLTSLAMLKVHVDQGQDYLDYLRPIVLQVLVDHKPELVSSNAVCDYIRTDFGLEIPERAVQVVIKRLSRKLPIHKEDGVYRITGALPDPQISVQKADADRHIKSVVADLIEFSEGTVKPITTEDEAVNAICAFLQQFNIECLSAYLRGTAIPNLENHDDTKIVMVSKYILTIQSADPYRFESFMVVVNGHMLANALLCPDLQSAPRTYKGVVFYLDTPLLVRLLGLEGEPKRMSVESLIVLLKNLGATVAAFSHSQDELESVIKGSADHLEASDGRGFIISEARRNGTTKSDLILISGQVDDKLKEIGVEIIQTPRYIADYQIDESAFEKVLAEEVSYYYNPRAKEYDINSVRSIYVLRSNTSPISIERSKAVLVTNNSSFAKAAFQYGQQHTESRQVSSVITDFSLANMAWLKAPLGAPNLPMTEVMAFSYAALQPSKELLNKYLSEIGRLEKLGKITARDHQLLRSNQLAQDELMNLTLGEEDALTEQTVTETLRRVTFEIKKEETGKFLREQREHRQTQESLALERTIRIESQERVYWYCSRRAKKWSWIIAVTVALLVLGGFASGIGLKSSNPVLGFILLVSTGLVTILSVADMMIGFSIKELRVSLEKNLLSSLLKKQAALSGLDLSRTG